MKTREVTAYLMFLFISFQGTCFKFQNIVCQLSASFFVKKFRLSLTVSLFTLENTVLKLTPYTALSIKAEQPCAAQRGRKARALPLSFVAFTVWKCCIN